MSAGVEFLRVTDLHAFYGESHILHGVDFSVNRGEVVTLLGRNGAGRTTTLKSILGLVGHRSGSIMINGREAIGLAPHKIAHLGIGYCPEERGIFSSLSCEENLLLPPAVASSGMSVDEIYDMFPNLKEHRTSQGSRLSGGEQQMLAVARILRTGAQLLLLDEISEGLAPVIVQQVFALVQKIRAEGYTVLIVEQNIQQVLKVVERAYLLEVGRIKTSAKSADLLASGDIRRAYIGL
ncbi:MAG: ABC transporter ATP-binding protein [Giesbergeria sp.]